MKKIPNSHTEPEQLSSVTALTHLLAMNTMMEAARAGREARGFAAVAGEIQDLSRKTNQSFARGGIPGLSDIKLDQDDLDMAVHDQLNALEELNTTQGSITRINNGTRGGRDLPIRDLNHLYQLLCHDQGNESA
jgi:hypothetical protein